MHLCEALLVSWSLDLTVTLQTACCLPVLNNSPGCSRHAVTHGDLCSPLQPPGHPLLPPFSHFPFNNSQPSLFLLSSRSFLSIPPFSHPFPLPYSLSSLQL